MPFQSLDLADDFLLSGHSNAVFDSTVRQNNDDVRAGRRGGRFRHVCPSDVLRVSSSHLHNIFLLLMSSFSQLCCCCCCLFSGRSSALMNAFYAFVSLECYRASFERRYRRQVVNHHESKCSSKCGLHKIPLLLPIQSEAP